MDARRILQRPYARKLTPQEDGFVATIQEFPGCIADGRTADEALKNLESAAESWIEATIAQGREVPEPIDIHGFSGKIALRIPRGLHKQAAEMALAEGASVNQLLTAAIASYLGGKRAAAQLVAHFTQNNLTLNYFRLAVVGQNQVPVQLPGIIMEKVASTSNG